MRVDTSMSYNCTHGHNLRQTYQICLLGLSNVGWFVNRALAADFTSFSPTALRSTCTNRIHWVIYDICLVSQFCLQQFMQQFSTQSNGTLIKIRYSSSLHLITTPFLPKKKIYPCMLYINKVI